MIGHEMIHLNDFTNNPFVIKLIKANNLPLATAFSESKAYMYSYALTGNETYLNSSINYWNYVSKSYKPLYSGFLESFFEDF